MIQHALSRSSRAAATLCPTPPTPPPPPFSLAAPLIPPQVPHPPRVYSQSTTSRNITRFTVYTSGNAPRVHSGRDVARITELLGNISRMPPALTYRADCNVGSWQRPAVRFSTAAGDPDGVVVFDPYVLLPRKTRKTHELFRVTIFLWFFVRIKKGLTEGQDEPEF